MLLSEGGKLFTGVKQMCETLFFCESLVPSAVKRARNMMYNLWTGNNWHFSDQRGKMYLCCNWKLVGIKKKHVNKLENQSIIKKINTKSLRCTMVRTHAF